MNIKTLAQNIYLGFNDEEWESVETLFENFENEVIALNEINTENVKSMHMPFELNENSLRMDEVGSVLSVEEVLLNAADSENNMVKIVKVVG